MQPEDPEVELLGTSADKEGGKACAEEDNPESEKEGWTGMGWKGGKEEAG